MTEEGKECDSKPRKEAKTDYFIEAQDNLMRVVEFLEADVCRPTSLKELCAALDISQNKALWVLYNLRRRNWVEQVGDAWRLGPRVSRISEAVRKAHAENLERYLG